MKRPPFQSKVDQILHINQVPECYWNPKIPTPASFAYEKNRKSCRLNERSQQEWLTAFLTEPIRLTHPYLLSISSLPSDELAKMAAFAILRRACENGLKIGVIDVGTLREKPDCDIVIIQGLLAECTWERAQLVKDLIYRYKSKFRLVVSGGGDPITFALQKLRTSPDAAFYFEGMFGRTLNI